MNGESQNGAVQLPPLSGQRELAPAPIYDVNQLSQSDDRTRTLKQLLDKGHVTVAPLREPQLILHSHLPHVLGSAYGLGAGNKLMTECYEHVVKTLVEIDETFVRGEKVNASNWRDFLQQKSHTVAYVDFFDQQIEQTRGDFDKVVQEYLCSGSEPVVNGMIGGLGHPFIHLAYAYEFRSKAVASEALSLCCTEYVQCHGLLDHPPPDNSTYKTASLADVVQRVHNDSRFDGIIEYPGTVNFGLVLQPRFDALTEHWNAWTINAADLESNLENACDLSVLLAISASYADGKFDFFYAHTLTVAHALRILWHYFPADRRESILRQYALFTILIYILQYRKSFGMETLDAIPTEGRDWNWVREKALSHKWALDEHFFKVVRALQELDATYGSKKGFYLKAAILFIEQFNGWEGFGQGIMGYLPSRDGYIPA